jgi:integrase
VKVICGRQHLFGRRWCSWQEALNEYNLKREDLEAGRIPAHDASGLTLREGLRKFLESRKARLDSGEITQRTYDDYYAECVIVRDVLGADIKLSSIGPHHFERLRQSYSGTPTTISNRIGRVKVAFKYIKDAGLVERDFQYGPSFHKPSAKSHRLHRAEQPKKLFTPEQIKLLLQHAKPQMKAMVCLGLFAGFGNTDCGTVEARHFHGEWVEYHRPKTGVHRKAWLPPEAIAAVRAVQWPLRTKYGNPWTQDRKANPVSAEFRKLAKPLGIELGFYALRHTCATIGHRSRDSVAVDYIMGHVTPGMGQTYREEVADDNLRAVGETIYGWLHP